MIFRWQAFTAADDDAPGKANKTGTSVAEGATMSRTQPLEAEVAILVAEDTPAVFERCLESVLAQVPQERIELRVACARAPACFDRLLARLCPEDDDALSGTRLPLGDERWDFWTAGGMRVWAWY